MTQDQLSKMQQYVGDIAITPSVFRPMGGCVKPARKFLGSLDLTQSSTISPSEYARWLNDRTKELMGRLPIENLWGSARKSINIFMTMALLNRILCEKYALERLADELEVPLDSIVVKRLAKCGLAQNLLTPKWTTIRALDPANSEKYQQIATAVAKDLGIPRGLLDTELWEPPDC